MLGFKEISKTIQIRLLPMMFKDTTHFIKVSIADKAGGGHMPVGFINKFDVLIHIAGGYNWTIN